VLLLLLLVGCDRGPRGPWDATLLLETSAGSPAPASMLVFLGGSGILGVEGEEGTRVWWEAVPEEGGVRVVALRLSDAGAPSIRVRLEEGGRTPPVATLLALAGTDNARILPSEAHRLRWLVSR